MSKLLNIKKKSQAWLISLVLICIIFNSPFAQNGVTYSTSHLFCESNSNFIALYCMNGPPPYSFTITGPVSQTNSTGYFSNLPNGTYNATITNGTNNTFTISNIQAQSNVSDAAFITADNTICIGNSTQILASGGNGIYNWNSNPNDPSIQFVNDSTAIVAPSTTTTYTLLGESVSNLIYNGSFQLGNSGFFSNYTLVNQITNPVGQQGIAGVSSSPNLFFTPFANCSDQDGNNAMLVADGATSAVPISILWLQAVPVQPNTNYTFTFWATSVVAANPAQLQTQINGTLVNSTTLSASVCNWQQITMTWNSGASEIAVISLRDLNIQSNGNDFAIDNLSFSETNPDCSTSMTITVVDNIPIDVQATAEVCVGGNISITPNNGTELQWTHPNGSIINNSTLSLNNISLQDFGTYTVSSSNASSCFGPTQFTLEQFQLPVTVNPSSTVIDPGSSAQLNAFVGGGITNYTVSWSPEDGLSCTDCLNPIASPSSNTTYQVTIITDDGCSITLSVEVIVEYTCKIVAIPSIFSPNNDGLNDEFCLQNPQCVNNFELSIYNRWGELVFYTNNPNVCWDGTFRGQAAPVGVYAYKIFASLGDDFITDSGNISLVK
jgi:gliding motility-associated-like protein